MDSSAPAPSPFPDIEDRLFANGDYVRFLIARVCQGLAMQMILVGLGWYVYDITRSAMALGFVGLAIFLPTFSLSLVTGHFADTRERSRIMGFSFIALTLAAIALTVLVSLRLENTLLIYVLLVFIGTARAFANPAGQALVPSLVPRSLFGRAIALNSSANQTTIIVGPSIGGLLYVLGPEVVFATAAGIAAIACFLAFSITPRDMERTREPPSLTSLLAGLSFIRSRQAIFGAISLDLFAVLLGGATSLMPIIARDVLETGPWGLGLLRSGPAVGAVLVGLWLSRFPIKRHAGRIMFATVALFGVMTIGFGLSHWLPLSLFCLTMMGAADMISVFIRLTLVQLETPEELRGRVSAVNSVFIGASNELGDFESGLVAAAIGAVPAVVVGGVGTILIAGLWALMFPDLRKRDTLG
jgi:MFS family permease